MLVFVNTPGNPGIAANFDVWKDVGRVFRNEDFELVNEGDDPDISHVQTCRQSGSVRLA